MTDNSLPIDAVLPQVVDTLRRHPALVITAPTGTGKTTRVPPALLDSGLAGTGQIVMLEPRRLAARAAARRMAAERGGRVGDEVGYQVRFDRQCGPRTRILVVTEGLLVRMLHDDPYLENVSIVLFDEFHERSLDTDLALAMVRLMQRTIRPELRLVVMSATLAANAVAHYLDDCPIVSCQGRLHPVEIVYDPRPVQQTMPVAAAEGVDRLLRQTTGDLLVFLPGRREIRQTAGQLSELAAEQDLLVLPLHGELAAEEQDVALTKQNRRKVVLATNVAETSITVDGVTGVVDTGVARILTFDPRTGLDRLELTPISRASADQRAGRAGRTQPGVCLRLWSEAGHRQRAEQSEPEICRIDLAGSILQLLSWGERDLEKFPWFEAPPVEHVEQALTLLGRLGAVAAKEITAKGRELASLPMHPRLGCLLIEGARWGYPEKVALAAAVLSERDPFAGTGATASAKKHATQSDVLDRVEAIEEFERRPASSQGLLNRDAVRFILQVRKQLIRSMDNAPLSPVLSGQGAGMRGEPSRRPKPPHPSPSLPSTGEMGFDGHISGEEAVLRSLLAAFPDRLVRRREPGSRKGIMVGGRGVKLGPSSNVMAPELFLCIDVDDRQAETLVWQASAVERAWLAPERLRTLTVVQFDPRRPGSSPASRSCTRICCCKRCPRPIQIRNKSPKFCWKPPLLIGTKVVPGPDSPAGQYLTRLRCLRAWMPELNLPAVDEAALRTLLPELCSGCKSFADLHKAPWQEYLESRLSAPAAPDCRT